MTEEMKAKYNITSTKDAMGNGVKLLVYGASGSGKTTLAGTFPGKTLILNAENGTLVLRDKDIDVINVKTLNDMQIVYTDLLNGNLVYDNVVIDSLTEVAETIKTELDADPYFGDNKNTFKLWDEFKARIIGLAKAFRDLPGFNVQIICLSELVEVNGMQRAMPMIPHKKSQAKLMSLFDECLFLTSNQDGERCIYTQDALTHVAKTRIGIEDGTTIRELSVLYPELVIKKI